MYYFQVCCVQKNWMLYNATKAETPNFVNILKNNFTSKNAATFHVTSERMQDALFVPEEQKQLKFKTITHSCICSNSY